MLPRRYPSLQILVRIGFITCALLLTIGTAASKEISKTPEIGGFHLGMTNAQAARIGLSDCARQYSYSDIKCVPNLPSLPGEVRAQIWFDAKTKRAKEMSVHLVQYVGTPASSIDTRRSIPPNWSATRWWQETDKMMRIAVTQLGAVCKSRFKDANSESRVRTESCYVGEVTQRVRSGYNEIHEAGNARNSGNEPHYQVLLTLKPDGGERRYRIMQQIAAKERKAKFSADDFAAGK